MLSALDVFMAPEGFRFQPAPDRTPLCVREQAFRYESEGSARLSQGAVSVGPEAWWSVALSVPDAEGHRPDDTLFLQLERHGVPPADYRGDTEIQLSLPRSEVDAVVALLAGVVSEAHRSGSLPIPRD
jgi:hypothetical protein